MICGHHLQDHFLFGGCVAVASPVHLMSQSFAFISLPNRTDRYTRS